MVCLFGLNALFLFGWMLCCLLFGVIWFGCLLVNVGDLWLAGWFVCLVYVALIELFLFAFLFCGCVVDLLRFVVCCHCYFTSGVGLLC